MRKVSIVINGMFIVLYRFIARSSASVFALDAAPRARPMADAPARHAVLASGPDPAATGSAFGA